ncbi:thioredoxin family protein [Candidatus Woesearchaeota archaeon]|nr:thioredoxin family protein [Candidatus Woesearchaeota archaeon]
MKGRTVALIIVLLLIAGAVWYIESQKPDIPESEPTITPTLRGGALESTSPKVQMTLDEKAKKYPVAPDFIPTGEWINSEPLTIAGLRGKVVLVDFWTYSCINCIRTLPYLTSWDAKYRDAGLVIVGSHTPEFEFEKDIENVKRAMEKHGIAYPVFQDNEFRTWRAYRNQYWPHKYLVDIDGFIRFDHIGEGGYVETEELIQELLKERMQRMGEVMDVEKPITTPEDVQEVDFGKIRTPELYFGYAFRRHAGGNEEGYPPEKTVEYLEPKNRGVNIPYMEGTWNNQEDFMQLEIGTGKVYLTYNAKSVNIVASSDAGSTVEVLVDGVLVDANAGSDVVDGSVSVADERLYNVVMSDDYEPHELELRISGKGFRIYTFTFG